MTRTALDITCLFCGEAFNGFVDHLVNVTDKYKVDCPLCEKLNVISGLSGFVDFIPKNAVKVTKKERYE